MKPEKPRRVSSPSFADPELPPTSRFRAADYADLYATLLAKENVRRTNGRPSALFIWGPFEARLQQPDMLILGSLNEGTWPEAAEPGPWLNRPMRATLGLPSPEEEIGHAAHDFTSLLGAEAVYLTRAEKVDGVPTVPSRWLLRLNALLNGMDLSEALAPRRRRGSPGRARATSADRDQGARPSHARRCACGRAAQRHGNRALDRQPLCRSSRGAS